VILIITNKEDVHPDRVIDILTKNNIPFFRLNTEAILSDYKITYVNDSINTFFYIRDIKRNVSLDTREISAIWERRPAKPEESNIQDEKIRQLCLKEANELVFEIRYFLKEIFSIGHVFNDRIASAKTLQHNVANKVGFLTPSAIISNDFSAAKKIVNKYNSVAQKSLSADSLELNDYEDYYVFWTKKRQVEDIVNFPEDSFELTFNYLQEYIEKEFELRVTVVCDDIFACKIESQHLNEEEGKVDFRQGYEHELIYSEFNLPHKIRLNCLAYLNQMNLNFGCFDILVTKNKEYIFLECNPNGQWSWIEEEAGLPISKSIAKHLSKAY
jgi:hypothetical protein